MRNIAIVLLFAFACVFTTAASAQEVPEDYFGMHVSKMTNPWPTMKFGTQRLWDNGVSWSHIHTGPSSYNWTNLDARVSTAEQRSLDIIYVFGRTPQWASSNPTQTCSYGSNGCAAPPKNMADWENFVSAVASRYAGRIKYYELWNEWNHSGFYSGDMATLVDMARRAYGIIKAIDPGAVVLTPSTTGGSGDTYMSQYMAAGGGPYADVIAFHGYYNTTPESINVLIGNFKTKMAAAGQGHKPMWDTEASWGTANALGDHDAQAAYLVRQYLLHWSGGVKRFVWYGWDYTEWGTLWDPVGGEHKAGVAYRNVYNWMVGATLVRPCSKNSSSTWTCEFTRPGGYQALAVWNASGSTTFLAPSQYVKGRDIYGGTFSVSGSVAIGTKPVLLETGAAATSTAALNVTPTSGVTPLTVTADSNASTGSISSRTIDFGDGTVSTSNVAQHTYYNAGTYTVRLTVTDISGTTSTTTKTVTATAPAPAPEPLPPTPTPTPTPTTCVPGTATPSVVICSPANGATVSPMTRILAAARSSVSIRTMTVYVDGRKVYSRQRSSTVDTTVALKVGRRQIVVQAKDASGRLTSSTIYVNVQ